MHQYQVTINERHLDTFGHVNNAKYLELYEEARWELITGNGFGLDTIKKLKQGPVVLEVNLTFKKEITNREVITIESKSSLTSHPLFMKVEQQMLKADGTVASTIELKIGLMDLAQRKLIPPTEQWLKAVHLA